MLKEGEGNNLCLQFWDDDNIPWISTDGDRLGEFAITCGAADQ
jgi:hypothetical protein